MNIRTPSSVTESPCACSFLEEAANDTDSPIIFDEQTGEYQFQYNKQNLTRRQRVTQAILNTDTRYGALMIYHCPFCGGAAPESKRHLLFETIPCAEESRLARLLKNVNTIDEAIKRFGQPDVDGQSATKKPESDGCASIIEHHRHFQYHRLSDIADVWFTERPDGSAYWQLHGKYKSDESGKG